jgi:hypothetical protein
MQLTNSLALKEWAVIVHALGIGKQTLLLRKGGLHERHGRFAIEPTEFFLFPTYVHQMAPGVISEILQDLGIDTHPPPIDEICITHYATVHEMLWLDTLDRTATLAGLHCWTADTITQRFAYGKSLGLHLFVLRVYQLPQPHMLPKLTRYGGCRSWVTLAESLSTLGATPVLSDEVFAEQLQEIHTRLARVPCVQNTPT